MSLYTKGGQGILGRAPRIKCDTEGCRAEVITCLDGVEQPVRTPVRPGWVSLQFSNGERLDYCPACAKVTTS